MIRVAYFHHECNVRNGSTKSLLNMIHSLKDDIEPIVIFPQEGSTVDWFRSLGIKCEVFPFSINVLYNGKGKLYWKYRIILGMFFKKLLYFNKAKKFLIKNQVDIIHSNVSVIQMGYNLSKTTGIPHVWHLREFIDKDFNWLPATGFKKLRKDIMNSQLSISITNAIKNHFIKSDSSNSVQIFNAIIENPFTPISYKKEKYFLFAGRINSEKGLFTALKAFKIFQSLHPDFRLKLVGECHPNTKIEIENFKLENQLSDKIELYPFTDNLHEYYVNATALLMCSKMEGLGRVTVEAMDHGCPVIGFNSGGTAEIITHKVNGLLFSTIEECVDMMNQILNKEFSDTIIDKGKLRALDFTEKIYRTKILNEYAKILKSNIH